MERATINDATIPILADGIKWLGYVPEKHLLWNLGFYGDWLSEGQSFSTYDKQAVGRLAWLPVASEETRNAAPPRRQPALRQGRGRQAAACVRGRRHSRHRYFVDTGTFAADRHEAWSESRRTTGPDRWLFGGEYFFQQAKRAERTATRCSTAATWS